MNDRQKLEAMREILARRFPNCFVRQGDRLSEKRPLKIGIRDDLMTRCPDLNQQWLARAIGDYCTGPKYSRIMIAGTERIDLDGNPAGTVSEADQANAEFRERRRKRQAQEYSRNMRAAAKIARDVAAEEAAAKARKTA